MSTRAKTAYRRVYGVLTVSEAESMATLEGRLAAGIGAGAIPEGQHAYPPVGGRQRLTLFPQGHTS